MNIPICMDSLKDALKSVLWNCFRVVQRKFTVHLCSIIFVSVTSGNSLASSEHIELIVKGCELGTEIGSSLAVKTLNEMKPRILRMSSSKDYEDIANELWERFERLKDELFEFEQETIRDFTKANPSLDPSQRNSGLLRGRIMGVLMRSATNIAYQNALSSAMEKSFPTKQRLLRVIQTECVAKGLDLVKQ